MRGTESSRRRHTTGSTITCALTADGLDGTYDVTVTTTSVDGDTADFDVQVADTPR